MKQLPASHWEKMGLQIGGGMGNVTNDLLRKSNLHLAKIAAAVTGTGGKPKSTFGMSPAVANA